ncbi:MAG: glycosyltransferase family 9 protein [Candidatus Omnitrophica bacterium]|nr:glycosyltransferase family 9 protein [Candidatus Omnitrophota bacterium]
MRILINFPTNIGDTILALPVLDRLKANYPESEIVAIGSYRTKDFLSKNIFLDKVIVYDKHWGSFLKLKFCLSLKKKFDIVVDLKNSFLPILIGYKKRTPFFRFFSKDMHAKDRYLKIIKNIAPIDEKIKSDFIINNDKEDNFFPSIFIACSSRSKGKTYPKNLLKEVIDNLKKIAPVAILGESADQQYYSDILLDDDIINFVGKTSLVKVFYLLKNYAKLLICVDSSILQLASYIDIPIIALFGPTDERRYGPWSTKYVVLKNEELLCRPCGEGKCNLDYKCMHIQPLAVIEAAKKILNYNENGRA